MRDTPPCCHAAIAAELSHSLRYAACFTFMIPFSRCLIRRYYERYADISPELRVAHDTLILPLMMPWRATLLRYVANTRYALLCLPRCAMALRALYADMRYAMLLLRHYTPAITLSLAPCLLLFYADFAATPIRLLMMLILFADYGCYFRRRRHACR